MKKLKNVGAGLVSARGESGITLVALIITIIVMLILVGVSVQMVINSDLIGTVQEAGDRTATKYQEEGNISEVKIGNETYSSIDEYLNGKEITVESLTITGKTEVIQEDEIQLAVEITASEAEKVDVEWTSSDETIATVDSTGKVTGVLGGTGNTVKKVTITATAGGKSATHEVTVIGLVSVTVEGYMCYVLYEEDNSVTQIDEPFTFLWPNRSKSSNKSKRISDWICWTNA